ncbi:MAG: DUF4215 domain-containing protein [Polyangiaceae bacterium]
MRRYFVPAIVTGLLLAACGDDTTGGGGSGGSNGGENPGGAGGTVNTGGGGNGNGGTVQGGGGAGGGPVAVCGDGAIDDATEQCDDGNTTPGDGCDDQCDVEQGFDCTGAPSTCVSTCGDGVVASDEDCDDGNVANTDGCSSMCAVESGYDCGTASPSVCAADCGDGVVAAGAEQCDDGNTTPADGCDGNCATETGWACMGEPSVCSTGCGDGIVAGMEECDDQNMADGDGCSSACVVEQGYGCSGMPSFCELAGSCSTPIQVTGDGFTWQAATLDTFGDDLNNTDASCAANSGMSAKPDVVFTVDLNAGDTLHVAESGTADVLMHVLNGACDTASTCLGSFDGIGNSEITPGLVFQAATTGSYYVVIDTYSSSTPTSNVDLLFEISPCGDGAIGSGEQCDDGNIAAGDGCSPTCAVEAGYSCAGTPSVCTQTPGLDCANPIVASDGFVFQSSNIAQYADNYNYSDASCQDVGGSPNASPEVVFQISLNAGERLNIQNLGTLDTVMQVTQGTCGAGTCFAKWDDPENPGLTFTATTTDTYYVAVESYSASPSPTATIDLHFTVATCGDSAVELGEPCDDGNTNPGDGCSATCTVESGYSCTGSPSVCTQTPGVDCGSPIVATDGFTFAGSNIAQYSDNYDFTAASCTDVVGTPNASPELVFSVNLNAGQRLNVKNFGTLDVVWQLVGPTCGAGACLATYDSLPGAGNGEQTTGLQYTATTSGTYYVIVESYSNTPPAASTYDLRFEIATCGDGVVEQGEPCDDGNGNSSDGCSSTCTIEAGYTCSGSPSVCTNIPAATCAAPIIVNSPTFQFAGTNIAQYGDTENYNAGTNCVDVSTTAPSGYDLVFQVNALAGDTIKVRELGGLDAVFHILTQPQCGAGVTCAASTDANETTGITYTAPAAGPIYVVLESWGNPTAATTFDLRIDTIHCGDGTVTSPEACDDGNNNPGDGCSATCTVEAGYTCAGSPSICALPEINCNDGIDNNGVNGTDAADPSCALPAYFPACGGGQHLLVYPGTGGAIPDGVPAGGLTSNVVVSGVSGLIQKAALVFNITHTWDNDVDMFLTAPGGMALDINTDNGSSGDNFTNTVLDSTCASAVTGGTAPFSNCYSPEASFATFNNTSPNGTWSVRFADDTSSDVGTVNSWSLVLCTN